MKTTSDQAVADLPMGCSKAQFLTFIVPTAIDGADTLAGLCAGAAEQAEKVAQDWEILLLNHGGEAGTRAAVEDLLERDPDHVRALHLEAMGRSDALARGYREAKGDFVLTLESDQDNDLAEILPLMERLREQAGGGPAGEARDRWQRILPRGVLRRRIPIGVFRSKTRLAILPV